LGIEVGLAAGTFTHRDPASHTLHIGQNLFMNF
jgi:hypothetical protein